MKVVVELIGIKEALAKFDPNKVRRAANMTLNRIATTARKQASDIITGDYMIKPAQLRKWLLLSFRASGAQSWAEITGKGRGISLRYFQPRQEGVRGLTGKNRRISFSRGRRFGGQVTARIWRGKPRSVIREIRGKGITYMNKPFVTRNAQGMAVVWVRKGKERFPVAEGMGPGVAHLFGSKRIMGVITKRITELWKVRFHEQLEWYLNGR